jgi:hypothetical protein
VDTDEQRARAALAPGERLLWWGRPDPSVIFTKADTFLVPFSVVYLGFLTYVILAAPTRGQGILLVIEIVFVAIGLYYLVGRFVVKAVQKRRTVYALTDSRALALVGANSRQGVPIAGQPVAVSTSRDGDHISVTIGQLAGRRTSNMYANTGLDFMSRNPGLVAFYDVTDAAGLEAALAVAVPPKAG